MIRSPQSWRRLPAIAGVAGLCLSQVQSAAAQTLGQGPDDGVSLWRVLAALLFCMILAVAGAFALKGGWGRGLLVLASPKRTRRLHLVETLRLNHQNDLCIVHCDGRELLVCASAQGAQLLTPLLPTESTKTAAESGT